MKIKHKVEMNLPQLIEWAMENKIKDRMFLSGCYCVGFDRHGYIYFNSSTTIPLDQTFTVEEEIEITEDTVIPKMLEMYRATTSDLGAEIYINQSINSVIENAEVLTLHIVNDDGTHTLIWSDGKLVE